jgi:alginate O-acetyltransferase complex protein AlgJ
MSEPTYAANSGITRRTILTGFGIGAIAGFPIEAPRAAIVNLVALGKDGWLFPVWDDVRHADIQKIRGMARFVSDAVGVIKHANIEMAISITPSKARVYREFLPDDFKFSADTDHRYAVAIEEYRRPGTLVPDLATNFANVRRAQPIEALFLKADTHWTAAAFAKRHAGHPARAAGKRAAGEKRSGRIAAGCGSCEVPVADVSHTQACRGRRAGGSRGRRYSGCRRYRQ